MATVETLEVELNILKADVKTAISKMETETTLKMATVATPGAELKEELKVVAFPEEEDVAGTAIAKADEPVAAAKPKEGEVKAVPSPGNKATGKVEKAKAGAAT
jgi:hypothetical protein